MNLFPKNILPTKEVKKFILIFYTVGVLGFLIPWTQNLFIALTTYALLLSTYLLLLYHEKYSIKDILVFSAIALLGFFFEVLGVNTGVIFGSYQYGEGLGIKIFQTPLLIGVNWLFLTYTALSISDRLTKNIYLQLTTATTLMLVYDIVMEQLAPIMDMWSWTNSSVPMKNYITWWLIGFLFAGILKGFKINTRNHLALLLFLCQFLFFVVLLIYYTLLK
ncbi:MAG: carotenoid biosynthesis protein [Bacteroidia bacterium]|nr:carotenoid biosynthesis protein [Bacteroidia bacterium]